ncbi:NAD(P)-dependent oxidoreductase [Acidaminobacter sp. JC074]|uniref:NAD(P)-dependent oxidoreductase n=1 Tax=Acidaminobacter sp. JC074 TaxID=2530199 RepID=UPI001F0F0B42|nr:NAD(P)-dependent oxidoreductase [Acidaminobacter sp. JC074]MCH4889666.1 NAD(P)-dependent oxidoreductase [Acidaminobacter sp. JC074]
MKENIKSEAERCLQCKKPKCVEGCPVSTQIPEMMSMLLEGQIRQAGQMLFDNNPLSIVCGLICHHEAQCEGHCILNHKKQPIKIGSVENYISDYNLDMLPLKNGDKNGKVGIIGSGPAGITIAFILARRGYDVTIFESHDKIGGVMRYGIPDFRLSKDILERIKKRLEDLGVKIRPNVLIGPVITMDDLFNDGYDSIFIGTGVWNPKKMRIKGESLGHVHYAIDYLKNPEVYDFKGRVTIIGAGNVAMDVARTAIRKGAKEVVILYRKDMEDMPASPHEIEYAALDGVSFETHKQPIEITNEGIIYKDMVFDETWKEVGQNKLFKSEAVIISVSQAPRSNIVSKARDIHVSKKGLVETDNLGHTTRQGVFASGDVVTGAKTVVEAVKYSKVVADAMDDYMTNK